MFDMNFILILIAFAFLSKYKSLTNTQPTGSTKTPKFTQTDNPFAEAQIMLEGISGRSL